jgi:gas vesicle protein
MGRITNFLAGFILGGLLGGGIALLLAPASGENIRGQIQERVRQVQLEVKQAAADKRAELEKQIESYRFSRPSALEREN